MKERGLWSLKFSTAQIVLIPAAIGINYIGKMLAQFLRLPLWLDSIGTILAAILSGPIIGGLAGAINNVIYGLAVDPVSFAYALTSIAIGVIAGVLAHKGFIETIPKIIILGLIVGVSAAIVSTPINIIFWGGQTGNVWGDALFAALMSSTSNVPLASFLDEIVVDLPDKLLTVIVSCLIYKALPKSLLSLFSNTKSVEKLD